jgi:DNA repair exonuclease SbcCD nuclease subunit
MTILNTADWHLTSDPFDDYRWEFLPWLKDLVKAKPPERINILGDLTEKKDRHSSDLVNRLTEFLLDLSSIVPIYILQGNHDFVSEDFPFFRFLSKHPRIKYIDTPYFDKKLSAYYIPWGKTTIRGCNRIYTHTSVIGALYANGVKSEEGIKIEDFKEFHHIISGHIHVPQQINNLYMIGSPYPIDFGDTFKGRVLLEDDIGNVIPIEHPSIKKIKEVLDVDDPKLVRKLSPGDQIKLEIHVPPDKFKDWPSIKKTAKDFYEEQKVIVRSITLVPKIVESSLTEIKTVQRPKDMIFEYCRKHGVPATWVQKGMELIHETE